MSETRFQPRRLWPAGPVVPPLGLGSWNTWDRMAQDDAVAMIRRAVDAGAGLFDVAYYNTGPHDENSRTDILFGRALRSSGIPRESVVLCGKLWLWNWPADGFRRQLEVSLERAGLDRFDAVVAGDFFDAPDMARLVGDIDELLRAGLIDAWGVNNWPIAYLRAAIEVASERGAAAPAFAQLKYGVARRSMAEGAPYGELFDAGVLALQASDAFEGGVLLGNTAPARKIGADVGGIRERIAAVAPALQSVAEGFGVPAARLALAFCLTNPATTNVLFGASRPEQLEANLGAAELAAAHGPEIRARLADLALDQSVASDGTSTP